MKLSIFKDLRTLKEIKDSVRNLKGMKKLLSNPEHWTKGQARKINFSNGVESFCLLGANDKINGPGHYLARRIMRVQSNGDIVTFNDKRSTKHKDILSFLNKCIKSAERLLESRRKAKA